MLLELVIWISVLAALPLGLAVLECWLWDGFSLTPGRPAAGPTITAPARGRPETVAPPFVTVPLTVSLADGADGLRLFCSVAGVTEDDRGRRNPMPLVVNDSPCLLADAAAAPPTLYASL